MKRKEYLKALLFVHRFIAQLRYHRKRLLRHSHYAHSVAPGYLSEDVMRTFYL